MVIIGKEVAPLHIQNTAGEHAHAPPKAARTNVQRGILQIHLPAILNIQVGIIPGRGQQIHDFFVFSIQGAIHINVVPLHVNAHPIFHGNGLTCCQGNIRHQSVITGK